MSLPEPVIAAFKELGSDQRGKPELAMLKVQRIMGGGVLSPLVEHLGDITHRMSHLVGYGRTVLGYEKVVKTYKWLTTKYGFEREMNENIRSNAAYNKVPERELRAALTQALTNYAEAHSKLVVYNRAQWLARQAAIDVGRQRWDAARDGLASLLALAPTEEAFTEHALEYRLDADGQPIPFSP